MLNRATRAWFLICTRNPQGQFERLCSRKARKGLSRPRRTHGDFSFFRGRMLKTLWAPWRGWGWVPVQPVGLCWATWSWEGRVGGPPSEGQRVPPKSWICLFSLGLLLAQVPGPTGAWQEGYHLEEPHVLAMHWFLEFASPGKPQPAPDKTQHGSKLSLTAKQFLLRRSEQEMGIRGVFMRALRSALSQRRIFPAQWRLGKGREIVRGLRTWRQLSRVPGHRPTSKWELPSILKMLFSLQKKNLWVL